jgi:SAM-dependent methyltransferase
MKDYKVIRNESFQNPYTLSQELISIASTEKTHRFLTNHSSLLIYTFLVDYVMQFSHYWFGDKKIKILDWGCGKGHITFLLKEAFKAYERDAQIDSCDISLDKVTNVDSSFRQKTPIIEKSKINVIPLNHPYKLPFENQAYDVILSFGVLEHVPHDQESLNEIQRVLKPNGLFFCFFLPYYLSWTQRIAHLRGNYYHDRLYSKHDAKRMTHNAGLQLLDIWHRQLLPKNNVHYENYRFFEKIDQALCRYTFLKYLATNIEFVAKKV